MFVNPHMSFVDIPPMSLQSILEGMCCAKWHSRAVRGHEGDVNIQNCDLVSPGRLDTCFQQLAP